jgi:uncharacterized membrane protein
MAFQIALASFAGAGAEFLETAAIAYALGRAGYPREALIGTLTGLLLVAVPAVFLRPLFALVPLHLFRLAAGALVAGMGMSWCVKSIVRMCRRQRSGWIGQPLGRFTNSGESIPTGFSYVHALVMTKSAAVEGFEVCVIVFPLAQATGAWMPALGGMMGALLAASGLVFLLHGKLQDIPEVSIKLWTGVLLSAIGLLWLWEGVTVLLE